MRHIVAIGGLLPAGNNALLIDYSLKLSGKARPRLGYIGTANGDSEAYRVRFEQLAAVLTCKPSVLPLFARTPHVSEWVEQQDVILVGGGNTRSMLAVWREWGLPKIVRRAWEQGTILTGWSAGAICWFDEGVTDSHADRLDSLPCLGLLPGSCCPHYSGEPERRSAYARLISAGRIGGGIAIDDGAGVHFTGDCPQAIIALGSSVGAYEVHPVEGAVVEAPLRVPTIDLLTSD